MAMKLRALLMACGFVDIGGWSFLGDASREVGDTGGLRNRLSIARSMLPIMRRYSSAPPEELDRFDECEAAVLREFQENGSLYIGPTASDLWARRPAVSCGIGPDPRASATYEGSCEPSLRPSQGPSTDITMSRGAGRK